MCDFGIAEILPPPVCWGGDGVRLPKRASEVARACHGSIAGPIFRWACWPEIDRLAVPNVALILDPHYPQIPRTLRAAIPPAVDDLVMRALARDPSQRFQTAVDLRAALARAPGRLDWPRARRFFAVAALTGGLVGGGLYFRPELDVPERAPTATPPEPALSATATPTLPATVTVTPTPTLSPTPTPTIEPTPRRAPTSTPRSTFTPTRTPVPVTPSARHTEP